MSKIFITLSFTLSFILFSSFLMAQVVVSDPQVPITNQAVVITFNAAEGNAELAGYTGDVYAHTGLITASSGSSSDWKFVKTNWGENTPDTKLTRVGNDTYILEITPSIKEYYGVPAGETILQLAFVFRSGETVGGEYLVGREADGGDIFVDVIESGLNLLFVKPENTPVLLSSITPFPVEVFANEASSVSLYHDDILIKTISGTTLQDTIIPQDVEKHWVKAIATDGTQSVADSFYYISQPEINIAELPEGIRDGINYMDDETVILSLLAPGKEYVYVIGDFNNWEFDNEYFMNKTPDGERFWLEINALIPGKEYIFQYLIDGTLRIADPYCDKVSDPWNDQYISEETYPGLISYPEGMTSGIASVLQTAQLEYEWEVNNFTAPKTTDLVIYECLVRDFTQKHSYAAIIDTLDYLETLGINVLELMPVNEFEGNLSWGYNPSFYFAPDKYYGPKNELKRLIDECHKRGIAVVLDIVLNHSYDQSPLVQMYFDGSKPTNDNPWYNRDHNFANPDAHWGNDFNHESIYTQNFVDSVNSYWMSEYRFDGFRFDFTKGFSNTYHADDDPWGGNYDQDRIDILTRMVDRIRSVKEDAIVIFEHLSENSEEKTLANNGILLWGNANYNYAEASMGYHDNNKSDFSWGVSYKKRGWNDPTLVGYMESHDEERIMYKNVTWGNSDGWNYSISDTSVALSRIRLISTFFYTVPGPKMIWQFGELGYDYSIDYNGRLGEKPVRWDYYFDWRRNYNYHFTASLIELTKSQDVFETENYGLQLTGPMKSIRLFGDSVDVVIVGNFDVTSGELQPQFSHEGAWYEFFTGDTLMVEDTEMLISLAPGEYRLYSNKHFETPDIGTSIGDHLNENKTIRGYIYPNPVIDQAYLALSITDPMHISIDVYAIDGSRMKLLNELFVPRGNYEFNLDTSSLIPGMYICIVSSNNELETLKFIIN